MNDICQVIPSSIPSDVEKESSWTQDQEAGVAFVAGGVSRSDVIGFCGVI